MVSPTDSFDVVLRALADAPPVQIDAEALLAEGDTVGGFVIKAKIGSGGMGVVYRAYDPELERTIALKLHRNLERDNATQRLLREAKTMAKLSHPNVLTIYEVGTHRDQVFIAMEYAPGGTLRHWLRAPRTWREIVAQFVSAGRGLAAAHDVGLVHRDFKADNVLLDTHGRPRVADFGLARAQDGEAAESIPAATPTGSTPGASDRLTTAGTAVGTVPYMPPEQYESGVALASADQFALCASLYEALYGRAPFGASNMQARLTKILAGDLPQPERTLVPGRIFAILRRGLAADPDARYPSMEALLADLGRNPRARRWKLALAGGLTATAAAAALLAADGPVDPCAAAAERIAETWSPARRDAVAAAFDPFDATARRDAALEAVEDYAGAWRRARVEACTATARGDQSESMLDLRVACLDRRRAALEGIARVLETADRNVAAKADQIVARLPKLEPCADAEALLSDVPPPQDEDTAAKVADLRAGVEEIVAAVLANRVKGTSAQMDEIEGHAAQLGYTPLHVEALYARGKLRDAMGHHDAAARDFDGAMMLALEIGYDEYVPLAAAKLAFVVGVNSNDVAEGERLLRIARATTAKRPSLRAQILVAGIASSLARQRGDFEAAIAAAKRAVDLRTELADGDEAAAWAERGHYAMMLHESGRSEEAGTQLERIVALLEERHGENDPRLINPLRRAAVMRTQTGDFAGALPMFERRVRIAQVAHGPESLELVECLRDVTQIYFVAGDDAGASASLDRALSIHAALPEPDPVEYSELLSLQAQLAEQRGDCATALTLFARAEEILVDVLGPHSRQSATILHASLECRTEVEGAARALEAALRALTIQETHVGGESMALAGFITVASQVAGQAADHQEVLRLAERGLGIFDKHGIDRGMLVTTLRFERGRALSALGREDEAKRDFVAALRSTDLQPPTDREHAEALRNLAGRLYAYPEHRARAHAAATKAREILRRHDTPWATSELDTVEAWLAEHPPPLR